MTVENILINEDLANIGVTKFSKENDSIQLIFDNNKVVIFDIHQNGIFKTIENLKTSARSEKLDGTTINKVAIVLLLEQNGYLEFLQNGSGRTRSKGHAALAQNPGDTSDTNDIMHTLPKPTSHDNNQQERSMAQKALELVQEDCLELFLDQFSWHYAAIRIGEHIETLPLKSSRFKNWLCKRFYESENQILANENVTNILNILKAKAEFGGNTKILHLRTASIPEEPYTIYYHMTNKEWQIIRVTENCWSIEYSPPIFRRYSNQQPQVYPSKEYPHNIFDRFVQLINVKDEDNDNKLLLKCYIISLFVPNIPKPILMLHGEQGSAKSTLQELIKMLVDPSSIQTVTFPRDINELVQKLMHNYICYFDNVSVIPDWISDQLCRAVTGSGFSKRELYSDDDDIIYNFKRCVGFNGINLGATKADLLDRGIIIELERILKENQRKLEDIWQEFDNLKPQLLGYIFDILAKVLQVKKQGGIEINGYPRMADFAEIGEIVSRSMGYQENRFLNAYYHNISLQVEKAIEVHPVAVAIIKFTEDKQKWRGTATQLLAELEDITSELRLNIHDKLWPKSPNWLSRRIAEVKTNLRERGIVINTYIGDPKTNLRTIEIRNISLESFVSLEPKNQAQNQPRSSSGIHGDSSDPSPDRHEISLDETLQERIQNSDYGDKSDSSDIFRPLEEFDGDGGIAANNYTGPIIHIAPNLQPIISIEVFFNHNPDNISYQSLPSHSLEESPCYSIIGIKKKGRFMWYHCKLHPKVENINLSSIEHHCKYYEPKEHKLEIMKSLNENKRESHGQVL